MMKLWKKILYENCGVKNYMKEDHRSYTCRCTTFAVAKRKPERKKKHSSLYGIQTLDLCDTSTVLYQ